VSVRPLLMVVGCLWAGCGLCLTDLPWGVLCRFLGWLGRFQVQPALLSVEQFTDLMDQLAEAHRVFLFCGKATEVHPAFFGFALHS
jgi:hypothetical protein